ncbi:MAG: LysE family translocator [Pseudomonadota bacterium]
MTETLPALALFAFASSITPGPNNLMLMASGANFGLRRTVPHMLGITLGHGAQVALVGLGLLAVFTQFPWLRLAILVVCSVYLLVLAWRVATAAPPGDAPADARPLGFLGAAAFQWVNPKAIYMSVYAQATYAPEGPIWLSAGLVAVVFAAINLPSVAVWAWGGVQVRRILATPTRLRVFNGTMALLLVASLYPIVTAEWMP